LQNGVPEKVCFLSGDVCATASCIAKATNMVIKKPALYHGEEFDE